MSKKKKEVYFDEKDLKYMLGVYYEDKQKIFIPNQFFKDLIEFDGFNPKISNVKSKKNNKVCVYKKKANANHIAFAFSYLYLISYMYRYAKYTYYKDSEECFIDDEVMYKMCSTSPSSRGSGGLSYITKKGGVLEQLGYIRKVNDFPIDFGYEEEVIGKTDYNFVEFVMYSEIKDELPTGYKTFNNRVNYPVKAIHIDEISEHDGYFDGYFYQVENTTEISIGIFSYCMSRKEIGKMGFYLYSFLKSKCDYYKATTDRSGYDKSIDGLIKETGLGKSVLIETLTALEKHNMISNTHRPYVCDLPSNKKIPANTYQTMNYSIFNKSGDNTVSTRKVMSYANYDVNVGVYIGEDIEPDEEIVKMELPF